MLLEFPFLPIDAEVLERRVRSNLSDTSTNPYIYRCDANSDACWGRNVRPNADPYAYENTHTHQNCHSNKDSETDRHPLTCYNGLHGCRGNVPDKLHRRAGEKGRSGLREELVLEDVLRECRLRARVPGCDSDSGRDDPTVR